MTQISLYCISAYASYEVLLLYGECSDYSEETLAS